MTLCLIRIKKTRMKWTQREKKACAVANPNELVNFVFIREENSKYVKWLQFIAGSAITVAQHGDRSTSNALMSALP